jgi:integrase/recombinase XerD
MRKNKLPVTLEPEEVQNLLKQPSKRYPTGLRNKTITSLMLHCGLRLSEVVNLKPGNINLTKGKLRVESGKGKKDRDLAIPGYLTDLLEAWRNIRPKSNFFFSTLKGRKLSDRYIQQMVKRYSKKAGINKIISPHTLHNACYGELPITGILTLLNIISRQKISRHYGESWATLI